MVRIYLLLIFVYLLQERVEAQRVYDDFDPIVNFGIQLSTIFPNDLLSVRPSQVMVEDAIYGLEPITGYSYGAVVNFRMSLRFYLMTGIHLLRRDYYGTREENGIREQVRFRTTTYELPMMASYYLRLSDRWLLNISSGIPLHFIPTDLFARNDELEVLSLKLGIIKPVSSTTVGIEFRTESSGSYYLGAVYNIAPWPLFTSRVAQRGAPENSGGILNQVGDFFGIQARFYFD